ncbi:MAG: hypothetical protein K0S05_288, partial [Agromyces sp.]|nr:hypothetical protein [Agromyces sp.]
IDACMAEKGLDRADVGAAEWEDAMYGNPGLGAAYRWQDAGCHGYAVHVTGNDNMH